MENFTQVLGLDFCVCFAGLGVARGEIKMVKNVGDLGLFIVLERPELVVVDPEVLVSRWQL